MVLVQEDDELEENVIYYLKHNLIDAELRYSHVDKLELTTVHAVQWSRHYILFYHTTYVAHINLFQFSLTRQMIGGGKINGLLFCKNSISSFFRQSRRSC